MDMAQIGPRLTKDRERFPPNNVLLMLAGAGLLWLGWAGFNGGDPYAANVDSSIAVINTNVCAAMSLLVWTVLDVVFFGKPSVIGAVQGMITGLVCITPAAGTTSPKHPLTFFIFLFFLFFCLFSFLDCPSVCLGICQEPTHNDLVEEQLGSQPEPGLSFSLSLSLIFFFFLGFSANGWECGVMAEGIGIVGTFLSAGVVQGWAAMIMGILSGSIPWYTMMVLHKRSKILQRVDDTLGVFHTHAVAGSLGGICTGLFAQRDLANYFVARSNEQGAFYGGHSGGRQLGKQLCGALFIIGWNLVVTTIILNVIRLIVPLRMPEELLLIGDDAVHGEEAYALWGDGEKYDITKHGNSEYDDTQHGLGNNNLNVRPTPPTVEL
jgi:ammonia channel protein AmtB